ncbi:membrane protein [Clostridia bacterium]|nr:membrane protein [Clostridia bacterium]
MKHKFMVRLFASLFFLLCIINFFVPKKTFSSRENRYLAFFPEFSWKNLVQGKYTKGIENYVIDQFVLRDQWIGLKTFFQKFTGESDNQKVYFTKDKSLVEIWEKIDEKKWKENIAQVQEFVQRIQKDYALPVYTMIAPTAAAVVFEQLPEHAPEVVQKERLEELQKKIPNCFSPLSDLLQYRQEYIYYHTDHHWTSLGAFYAYERYCQEVSLKKPSLQDYQVEVLSQNFLGTLYAKSGFYEGKKDEILAYHSPLADSAVVDYVDEEEKSSGLYARDFLEKTDQYRVFLNGNQSLCEIQTNKQNQKRLLVIKDSFANSFIPFLCTNYEKIVVVDLRYYKYSLDKLIEEKNISDILILYNLKSFSEDDYLSLLNMPIE